MQIVWFTDNAIVKNTIEKWLQTQATNLVFSPQCIANTQLYIDACINEAAHPFANETEKPILKNAVYTTALPINTIRCNFWPGFFTGSNKLEVFHSNEMFVEQVLGTIATPYLLSPNQVGFISARVVSMIINEAYFALEQGVSTVNDIDIAMKLGTNYPYGPFEWATNIGHAVIVQLLQQLQQQQPLRYQIAPALLAKL